MPQLNPHPWFDITLMAWLASSLIIQPKLLPVFPANPVHNKLPANTKTRSWTWPWT